MKNKNLEGLLQIVKNLPQEPGVYQYFDSEETIIYVGKAKNLKKRVSSYFTSSAQHTKKVKALVAKIVDIKVIIVDTELDALLLENNLIKKYQPHYNILLKDDKDFAWICIKKEPFPRLFSTRFVVKDGSQYFGPYANYKVIANMLNLIRDLYPRRTCDLLLTPKNIEAKKFKA